MAQTLFTIAIHYHVGNLLTNCLFKLGAQRSIVKRPLLKLFACESRRFTKSNDAWDVFSPGASLALLMSADVLSVKSHTAPDVERSDTFGRIQLVPRRRQQIATDLLDIQPQSSTSLHCIRMKPEMFLTGSSSFTNKRTDFSDRLERSDLIVRQHHCYKDSISSKRRRNVFDSYDAV